MITIYGIKLLFSDSESNKAESTIQKEAVKKISNDVFTMSADKIRKNSLVVDISGTQKSDEVVLSIVVNRATNKRAAREMGETFLRQVISNASGMQIDVENSNLSKSVGTTRLNYRIIVGYGKDEVLGEGIKLSSSQEIDWYE